ncbi:10810_t:CDS:1 [Funneliformis geosporum]|nr:10810_t:CDS:1 [Funneliformis geosporum]
MACSKIFSGDIEEITDLIIQYLKHDIKSLHSCILVNRSLCRVSIPILWEDPFSVLCPIGYSYNILDTYLQYLGQDDKEKLKELGIIIHSPTFKSRLFNYPSFIKVFNITRVEVHIVSWVNHRFVPKPFRSIKSRKITFHEKYEEVQIKKNSMYAGEVIKFLCISLIKILVNQNASLNDLTMGTNYGLSHLLPISKRIFDNPELISDLEKLTLNSTFDDFRLSNDELQPYLTSLPLSSSIKHLKIHVSSSKPSITNLIQSQPHLLSLTVYKTPIDIKSLSNSLISIKFNAYNFTDALSFESFKSLKQLRSLQFINCIGLSIQLFQPLLNNPSPLKLRSLKGVGVIPGIAVLIQSVGPYLKYLELRFLEDHAKNMALESIIRYCDKIVFLSLSCFDDKDAHLYNKIIHMNNHLRYLTIENEHFSYNPIESGLLKKLEILPNRLEYLNLKFAFDPNDLKLFLNNCNHLVSLNNLLVRNYSCYDGIDVTFKLLKNFVEENKVKNFAYQVEAFFDHKNSRHQYMERLARKIQPFVQMKNYKELVVKISDFESFS